MDFKGLRIFSLCCISLSFLVLLTEICFRVKGIDYSLSSVFLTFLLAGSGMELVRNELKNIRKIVSKKTQ